MCGDLFGGGGDSVDYSGVANSNAQAAALAKQTADAELAFRQKVYADQQPALQGLLSEATLSSQQQRNLAQQAADRSNQQWTQYQGTFSPIESQLGLDALGSQYLSPEQQRELQSLTQTMARPTTMSQTTVASGGLSPVEQQELDRLRGGTSSIPQQPARSTALSYQTVPRYSQAEMQSFGMDDPRREETMQVPVQQQAAAAPTQQGLTVQQQARLNELLAKQGTYKPASTSQVPDQAALDAQKAAQARINELQGLAQSNAVGEEKANAGKVRTMYDQYGNQIEALGNTTADKEISDAAGLEAFLTQRGQGRYDTTTGFYNKEAQDLLDRAKSKAATDKADALTRANASVATTFADRQRDMLRYGLNPNKFGDASLNEANAQSLARVAAGSQVGRQISDDLYKADQDATGLRVTGENAGRALQYADQNQGFGIRSAALDNARQIRAGASGQALATRFQGNAAATDMENTAKQRVGQQFTAKLSSAANFGRGLGASAGTFSNAASQGAGSSVGTLNTGVQGQLPSAQFAASGYSPYYGVAQLQQQGGLGLGSLQASGGGGGGFDFGGLGSLAGGVASLYKSGIFDGWGG